MALQGLGNPARSPFRVHHDHSHHPEQRAQLLANGRESLQNPGFDPVPVVKLFTPDAGATWLLTEIDPDHHDHAFGLCDLGLGSPSWAGLVWRSWWPCADAWDP